MLYYQKGHKLYQNGPKSYDPRSLLHCFCSIYKMDYKSMKDQYDEGISVITFSKRNQNILRVSVIKHFFNCNKQSVYFPRIFNV